MVRQKYLTTKLKENKMTKDDLQSAKKEEVFAFIRQRLSFGDDIENHLRHIDKELLDKEHKRFDMSGYESEAGQCTMLNMGIVNEFADLGIYDYTSYLFLDFYKGIGTLYFQYFADSYNHELELSGMGTTKIIYTIFEKTIFSKESKRRRI
jgi:hypothetical protein